MTGVYICQTSNTTTPPPPPPRLSIYMKICVIYTRLYFYIYIYIYIYIYRISRICGRKGRVNTGKSYVNFMGSPRIITKNSGQTPLVARKFTQLTYFNSIILFRKTNLFYRYIHTKKTHINVNKIKYVQMIIQ